MYKGTVIHGLLVLVWGAAWGAQITLLIDHPDNTPDAFWYLIISLFVLWCVDSYLQYRASNKQR